MRVRWFVNEDAGAPSGRPPVADTPIFHEVASEHGIVRAQEVRPLGSVTPIPQERLLLPSEQGTSTKALIRRQPK